MRYLPFLKLLALTISSAACLIWFALVIDRL
jgi:hypothetical protein